MEQEQQQTAAKYSILRQNCDFCVGKKVKCPGITDGAGCLNCLKKGVKYIFSLKRRPGPKTNKREGVAVPAARNPFPATGSTKGMRSRSAAAEAVAAASGSATLVTTRRTGWSDRSLARNNERESGVREGGRGLPMASPPSQMHLTPSKKVKATHDPASRAGFTPGFSANVGVGMSMGAGAFGRAADDRRNCGSFLSGGGAPMTPPSFHGLSPSSSAVVSHSVPLVDAPLGASRFEGGTGSSKVRRACSGGTQLSRAALQASRILPGERGGRAGRMASHIGNDAVPNGGGSYVSSLRGIEMNLSTLFDEVDADSSQVWDTYVSHNDVMMGFGVSSIDEQVAEGCQDRRSRKRKQRSSSQSDAGTRGGEDDAGICASGSHLQDSQIQIQHLKQQRQLLPVETPCGPPLEAHGHRCHRRQINSVDSSGSLVRVDARMIPQQQQQNDRSLVAESPGSRSAQSSLSPEPGLGFGSGDMAGGIGALGPFMEQDITPTTPPVPYSSLLSDDASLWGFDADETTLKDVDI